MQCCEARSGRSTLRRWWRGTGGCAGSGILLALLPKCPLCLAAYLGLWTGATWVSPLTHLVRPILLAVLTISIASMLATVFARRANG